MGVKHSGKGVKHPTESRLDSPRNSGDQNVRVAVALENKDDIDGHRHGAAPRVHWQLVGCGRSGGAHAHKITTPASVLGLREVTLIPRRC